MTEQISARPKRAASPGGADSTAGPKPDAKAPNVVAMPKAEAAPRVGGRAKAATTVTSAKASAAPSRPVARRPVAVPVVVDAPDETRELTIQQGGIGALNAADVAITQGGVGAVRADRVSVELGGVGAAMTDQLDVRQGVVGAVIARDARFEQAGVRTLIANRVHFGPNSGAGVVLAARVDGDVRTIFDWRGAIAFGAAAGVVMAVLRGRRR